MNGQFLRDIESRGEDAVRAEFISRFVHGTIAADCDGDTVETEVFPNGYKEISLFLGRHTCDASDHWGFSIELWAISDYEEADLVMWRFYDCESEINLPFKFCPMCGVDLWTIARNDDDD